MWVLPRAGSPTVTTRIFPAWKRSPESVVYSGATIAIKIVSQGQVSEKCQVSIHEGETLWKSRVRLNLTPYWGCSNAFISSKGHTTLFYCIPSQTLISTYDSGLYVSEIQQEEEPRRDKAYRHQSHTDCALGREDMRSATSAICTQHIIHFEGVPRARAEQRDPSTGYATFLSVADAR